MKALLRRLFASSRAPEPEPPTPATAPSPTDKTEGYSGDQPISRRDQDRFGRWLFAERIARTLAERRDPSSLVIGIYGAWGDGKTSTLRLMRQALEHYPHVILVQFNPWHFESQDQLLRSFFSTLADSTGKSLPTRAEELGGILKRYGNLLSILSLGAGPVTLSPGSGAASLGEALSTVELDELRSRLERILLEVGKRVIVFVDDVDRLDRKEIQAVFKLVKLSAGFDQTSYVLAFDDEMVAAALGETYGGGGAEAGRRFLEKIVQVPLHLPPADPQALRQMTFEGVDAALRLGGIELTKPQVDAFVRHFIDGLEPQLHTPRQARLYGNVLAFALPILKGEVHPVDQMLIEGVRIFYPKLYELIRDNRQYFIARRNDGHGAAAAKQHAIELINGALAGTGADQDRVTRRLLEVLFPRLKTLLGNYVYGKEWDDTWAREQRVCSEHYFDRYFRYAVPPGDLPDSRVAELVEVAGRGVDLAAAQTRAIVDANGMGTLIRKLRQRETEIGAPAAANLALALAQHGSAVPRERQMLFSDWSFRQAAILIAHLVRQVPIAEERREVALSVVRSAGPLAFGVECFRWLRKSDDQNDAERILPVAVEQELGVALAERIKAAAADGPLYVTYGSDAPRLIWLWSAYGTPKEVGTYLKQQIEANPSTLDELLDVYVGEAWGLESGLPSRSDFERHAYDAITGLLDGQWIYEQLETRYGDLSSASYHHSDGIPIARQIAEQFAVVHRQVQESQATKQVQNDVPQSPTQSAGDS
jgi:KAP family P-loop domain